MAEVKIGETTFDNRIPQICVPLVGESLLTVMNELQYTMALPVSILEWRMDFFKEDYLTALPHIAKEKGSKTLLCTVRTKAEGGNAEVNAAEYKKIVNAVIASGFCDIIDIELCWGEQAAKELINEAHKQGVAVVLSKHYFTVTPEIDEMYQIYHQMARLGADLPKLAVMPENMEDVLKLLMVSHRANQAFGPVIAISMGEMGKISRISGGFFGSCVTFAAGKQASAPGQMNVEDINAIIHDIAMKD